MKNISDLKPGSWKLVKQGDGDAIVADTAVAEPKSLNIADLSPGSWKLVQQGPEEDHGNKVYDEPIGPEQASAVDRFVERVKDPKRWQAIANNTGPYAQEVVAGTPPMVAPASALPTIAKYAGALAKGAGPAFAAARTAIATGQGAVMDAVGSHKEGESWADTIDHAAHGAKLSGGIQLVAESLPLVGKVVGPIAKKVSSAITGENENLIANYAKRTDDVNNLINQNSGDMTAAADQVRAELTAGIQKTKGDLNKQITSTLEKSKNTSRVSVDAIIEKLETAKAKLNPNFSESSIAEIDEMLARISSEARSGRADGGVDATGLYQIKQFLNEASKSTYNKAGQIFNRSSEAARAAKDAAKEAREAIKTHAPEISQADQQLAKLHQIEDRLNKNLLAPGKPDAALFAAGSGANPRNASTLRELEKVSGVPVMQRATDLATAKAFAKPSLLPSDATGKVVGRMLLGAGIGGYFGGTEGVAAGGMVASPLALKYGINAMNVAGKISQQVPSFAKFTRENPVAAQAIVQLMSGQLKRANPEKLPVEAEEYLKQNPRLLEQVPEHNQDRQPAVTLKGEDKWAQNGINKLGITDKSTIGNILNTQKGRSLLIEASDLPPGSKKLQIIKNKLQGMEQ